MKKAAKENSYLPHPVEFPAAPGEAPKVLRMPESQAQFGPISRHNPHPRYPEGKRKMVCVAAETYRDPQFKQWRTRLEFVDEIDPEIRISVFLNLGTGQQTQAGRRSKYRWLWNLCNGAAPKPRQVMSDRVFKGKVMLIQIRDVRKRHDGKRHAEHEIYSVGEVHDVVGP